MAAAAAMGFSGWLGLSAFTGTLGTLYHTRGLGNGIADLAGLISDVRGGQLGIVTQVFRQLQTALGQVQNIISSPLQSLARGMISQESWSRTEEAMQRALAAVRDKDLPNAIDLKDLQLFIELIIPDLMSKPMRGGIPSTVNEWMDATEQRQLRQLHKLILRWLGEGVDGEVKVSFVDVENILTNFLQWDTGLQVQSGQRRGRIMKAIDQLTGSELLAPVDRIVKTWRAFDPEKLVPDVAEVVANLCIQYASEEVPKRAELDINDIDIHEYEVDKDKLLEMGRAFKKALEGKHIPLYAVRDLDSHQLQQIRQLVLKEGEGCIEGTLLEGFCQVNDYLGEVDLFCDFDDSSETNNEANQGGTKPLFAERGSEVLYTELLQESISALLEQEIESGEATFKGGFEAIKGVRNKYCTMFQQPPEELFTVHEALVLITENPKLNERQQRTIINAKSIASAWLVATTSQGIRVPDEIKDDFSRALCAFNSITIEHDRRGIVHQPYTVHCNGNETQMIQHRRNVKYVMERNEGSLQRPIRQTLDRVRILKDSLGDLINALITAPRTILDTYTRPSVVAAIAIGILLLSSLMSAIFSLGSLHYLTSLSMAGGLSVGLHAWHRAEAQANTETATKVIAIMAAVALDGLSHLNDKFVTAQIEGSQFLNAKWNKIPVINHPMTI